VEAIALAVGAALSLSVGVITTLKGKWGMLLLGLLFWPAWVFAAIRLARPNSYWARRFYDDEKRARANRVAGFRRRLASALAVVPILLLIALLGLFNFYRIPSSAMEPALLCSKPVFGCTADKSDRVVGLRYLFHRNPSRGDIVAFRIPDSGAEKCGSPSSAKFVKRVVGLPGETWAARDGVSYINGKRLDEPYVPEDRRDLDPRRERIPQGHYWVLGDNRLQSCDSRVWGSLPRERLDSTIVFRYWPLDRIGTP
jgi:signal peptidase I